MCVCVLHSHAFGIAKAKKLCGGTFYSYVESHYQKFKSLGRLYSKPKVGDFVFFWSASLNRHGHIGIVVGVDANGTGFTTIEGNTSSGNDVVERNGGAIARKHYSSIPTKAEFGRPDYVGNGISTEAKPIVYDTIKIGTGAKGLIATAAMEVFDENDKNVGTINPTEKFIPDKKRYVNGVTQFHISTDAGGVGWCVPDHCYGWVYEPTTDDWWYVTDGYKWYSSEVAVIDGVAYLFEADGYISVNADVTLKTDSSGKIYFSR